MVSENKKRFFEFEDLAWFPCSIRESMTDYLRFVFRFSNLYSPVVPLLKNALEKSQSISIVDLCSGSGGPVEQIISGLNTGKEKTTITLTDKYPSILAWERLKIASGNTINYVKEPVDACNVPKNLKGFRTVFSGFHHFDKNTATAVIKNAVDAGEGIAVFDGNKSILMILDILILHPLGFIFLTPFIGPFRISRIIFTYLIPVIPFCTIWDGIVSVLRLYSEEQMLSIAKNAGGNYTWKSGTVKNKFGMKITYLLGWREEMNQAIHN